MEIKLHVPSRDNLSNRVRVYKYSKPFVYNKRGVLVHRPYSISMFRLGNTTHFGVHYWCGNQVTGRENLSLLDVPADGMIICAVCERKALEAGLESTSTITGRHFCTGGVKAVSFCCPERNENESL